MTSTDQKIKLAFSAASCMLSCSKNLIELPNSVLLDPYEIYQSPIHLISPGSRRLRAKTILQDSSSNTHSFDMSQLPFTMTWSFGITRMSVYRLIYVLSSCWLSQIISSASRVRPWQDVRKELPPLLLNFAYAVSTKFQLNIVKPFHVVFVIWSRLVIDYLLLLMFIKTIFAVFWQRWCRN